MSFWTVPIKPEINAVIPPQTATIAKTRGAHWNIKEHLTIKNTPAVNIVAECKSALTGVGPYIESGSQLWRPIWADLPTAPSNKNKATISTKRGVYKGTRLVKDENSSVWNKTKVIEIPTKKNKSPTLLIKKAFVAAFPAWARVYQNPINKYEHNPTPSQPKNKTNKLLDETRTSIKNVNKDKYDIKRDK